MLPLLRLAALALALLPAAAASGEPLLEATADTDQVRAALVNPGPRPVRVFVGFHCASSDSSFHDSAAFQLEVDGEPRPPLMCGGDARARTPVFVRLGPGERYDIGLAAHAQEVDQGEHRVVVRYRGARRCTGCWKGVLRSAPVRWPSTLSITLSAQVQRDGRVAVTVEHRNVSAGSMTVFGRNACETFDTLLVDGVERPVVESAPCADPAPRIEMLAPTASFVVRSELRLSPGVHVLEARYRVQRTPGFKLVQGGRATAIDVGHMSWNGAVQSSPVTVDLR